MIRRIGEYKGRQELFQRQSPEILENFRQIALIQSTESSSRLEHVTAEPERFKALMAEKATPRDRSEAEIVGYRDVLNAIHTSAAHIPFSEKTIQQFHRDLMKYTGIAGRKMETDAERNYRDYSKWTGAGPFCPCRAFSGIGIYDTSPPIVQ
jgi:Fic family protein